MRAGGGAPSAGYNSAAMGATIDDGVVRLALSGPAGAGKSSFLAALARELARGRLPGLVWRVTAHAPDPALADAVARLDEGYPARLRAAVELVGTLSVAANPGSLGALAPLEVELVFADAPGPMGIAPASEPVDGWLAIVPVTEDGRPPPPPPDWDRAPGAPLALGVAQADLIPGGEAVGAYLERAWPDWVARARARAAPCLCFGASACGRAHDGDAARPAPDAAPVGLAEPVVWLVRAVHDARWARLVAAETRDPVADATVRAARAFLAAFPVSPHRAHAARLARGAPGERLQRATPWIATFALVVATAGALRAFGVLGPVGAADTEAPVARRAVAEADHERALVERSRGLLARTPRTVEECDELRFGLSFLAELAALDPASAELASARGRCLDRVGALVVERERLVQLRRAQGVRDWTELTDVVDALWGQGSQGAAHEKLRALRQDHWRAWSARTRDRSSDHREVARTLEAFLDRCRPLVHASALLAPELAEARRFLADRWMWERLTTGGGFDGVVVAWVLVHRDCEAMRESDGSAQLAVHVGGVALTDHKDFPAREPDAEGWYHYDFTAYTGALKLEVPIDGTDFAIVKRNALWVNRTATVRLASPMDLFAPLGSDTKTLELDYGGNKHVRVVLRFEAASRLVLASLEDGR